MRTYGIGQRVTIQGYEGVYTINGHCRVGDLQLELKDPYGETVWLPLHHIELLSPAI